MTNVTDKRLYKVTLPALELLMSLTPEESLDNDHIAKMLICQGFIEEELPEVFLCPRPRQANQGRGRLHQQPSALWIQQRSDPMGTVPRQ